MIEPDTDYYNKLERGMKYVQGTFGLPLILSIDKYGNIMWYVDAAFVVHKDMRIHIGGLMTMGTGRSYFQSIKQKSDTKISTEADLVGVDDVLTQVICTRYFPKEQVYNIHDNIIYKDNQSAIKLERNGRQ